MKLLLLLMISAKVSLLNGSGRLHRVRRAGPSGRYWNNRMESGVAVETLLDPERYHKYIRPGLHMGESPLTINVSIAVMNLDKISDADMEYRISFMLYQSWRDDRLDRPRNRGGLHRPLTVDSSLGDRIWVPDTYMVNAQKSFIHDVTSRNGLITLYPNGTVLYVLRITSRASCPMKFKKYPMDRQVCKLKFASWSFTDDNLLYRWHKEENCNDDQGSLTGMEGVVLPQFNITSCVIYTDSLSTIVGNHSQLVLSFGLKRNMLFFILKTYIPSILLVMLSWMSFWINLSSVPARVALGATTVLSMTTLMIGENGNGPRTTSEVKAIDFYVFFCYGCTFLALLEYAVAHFAMRYYLKQMSLQHERAAETRSRHEWKRPEGKESSEFTENTDAKICITGHNGCDEIATRYTSKNSAEKIDQYSRIIFPASFMIFNVVYWLVYLTMDD